MEGYRMDGVSQFGLETKERPLAMAGGRSVCVVAGARSDRLHTVPHEVIVRTQFTGWLSRTARPIRTPAGVTCGFKTFTIDP